MIRVIIVGAKGRMGQALVKCLPQHAGLQLAAQIDQGDDLAVALPGAGPLEGPASAPAESAP